jgi:catechol 2,3-dioxygenase-like lactoylglutathione lyase family enzyme
MQVLGYTWAGVRTKDFQETVRFFSEGMGLPLGFQNDAHGVAIFSLPSGQVFEVVGPNYEHYDRHECPAIGFEVPDIREARREMEALGMEFVSGFTEGEGGAVWTHFRGPDGFLYGLQQRGKESP